MLLLPLSELFRDEDELLSLSSFFSLSCDEDVEDRVDVVLGEPDLVVGAVLVLAFFGELGRAGMTIDFFPSAEVVGVCFLGLVGTGAFLPLDLVEMGRDSFVGSADAEGG